jgi:hypothetical protein
MTGYQSKKAAAQDKLAQPEQEPVAWIEKDMQCDDFDSDSVTCEKPARAADGWEWIPLYTTPPQRPWVGLTDEDCRGMSAGDRLVAMWVDRTLKEKNT